MINDIVADMITRMRNAQQAKHSKVMVKLSKFTTAIAHTLKNEGFIKDYSVVTPEITQNIANKRKKALSFPLLCIELLYYVKRGDKKSTPVIKKIKKVSKSSCRQYSGAQSIPFVNNGLGVTILSTSQGVMSHIQAKHLNVGGEIILTVE